MLLQSRNLQRLNLLPERLGCQAVNPAPVILTENSFSSLRVVHSGERCSRVDLNPSVPKFTPDSK